MSDLAHLFEQNRAWAGAISKARPEFFSQLSEQQAPEYLWIGCADSRVPANEIVGLLPGELFVHRNVANLVIHTDFNCLSVIEYAVSVLKVRHIIVCGHYGCGGVRTAFGGNRLGLIANWLRHIRDLGERHRVELETITDEELRIDRLCELNVIAGVRHVAQTTMVESAWREGRGLVVHGWIYSLKDGLIRDLKVDVSNQADADLLQVNFG
jgi:carbonic anhydrase